MAKYHIEKEQDIQGQVNKIFYKGEYRWTTIFSDRKKYTRKSDATEDLYDFGGIIVTE